jgi:hypothetical protein
VRTELVFEREMSCHLDFSSGDWLCLFQLGLFSLGEETQVSLERKPWVLEAGASSTLILVRTE